MKKINHWINGKNVAGADYFHTTNPATGETIVDETLTSFDNGFIGLWLPKGIEAELSVQYEGKSASAGISTISDDDATCLTTLQLS